jgi:hypothetical protein
MSRIDPEVLYLILTKVATKESFYNFDPKLLAPGQKAGTITFRYLSEVYERVTNNRVGHSFEWAHPLRQLDELLHHCGLPPLGTVVVGEKDQEKDKPWLERLSAVQSTPWPRFGELKGLYRKK